LRATIRPSFVTPSRNCICEAARVEEKRISSSRVQRHLTGRPVFMAAMQVIGSVITSTLPPKPPPTVPPSIRRRLPGTWRMIAVLSMVK
jgi:hypothetical protein